MKPPITPRVHGILDYATVGATAAAPQLLPMSPPARRLLRLLAGTYLGLSLLTDYPWGARRAVPFPAHGATEVGLALLLPWLPKWLGFEDDRAGRGWCLGLTAITFVVAPLTRWQVETPVLPH